MLVGELLEELKTRSMREVCDDLGVHSSTVQRKIKKLGYEWDNSEKVWLWKHEEKQPLDVNIADQIHKKVPVHVTNNNHNHVVAVAVAKDPDDEIDAILKTDNNKSIKIQKGIYFEPEVAKALDKLVKKKLQSEFVNAAVKQVLKAKDLL